MTKCELSVKPLHRPVSFEVDPASDASKLIGLFGRRGNGFKCMIAVTGDITIAHLAQADPEWYDARLFVTYDEDKANEIRWCYGPARYARPLKDFELAVAQAFDLGKPFEKIIVRLDPADDTVKAYRRSSTKTSSGQSRANGTNHTRGKGCKSGEYRRQQYMKELIARGQS